MTSVRGGAGDEAFVVRSQDGGVTLSGGGGDDTLLLDWSDKTFYVRGEFRTAYGVSRGLFDDPLGGKYVEAHDVDRLTVLFGSADDQFTLGDVLQATVDGGGATSGPRCRTSAWF